MSNRLRKIFEKNGIKDVEGVARHSRPFWYSQPRCGPGTLKEIGSLLSAHGLTFAPAGGGEKKQKHLAAIGKPGSRKPLWFPIPELGDVYFIQAGDLPYVKIGFCQDKGADARLYGLQTGCPLKLRIIKIIYGCGRDGEKALHKLFAADRERGEWFRISPALRRFVSEDCSGEKSSTTFV